MLSPYGDEEIVEELSPYGDAPVQETTEHATAQPAPIEQPQAVSQALTINRADLKTPRQIEAAEELQRRGKIQFGDMLDGAPTAEDISQAISGMPQVAPGEIPDVELAKQDLSIGDALIEGAKNFPSSVKKQMTSLVEAVTSPAKTWEGVKALSKDIYKNQMEVALKDMGFDPSKVKFEENSILEHIENTPALDFVIDDLDKTYGSYEGFKNAIANDPARVITDMASIVAPTAKGVESVALASKLPGVAKVAGAIGRGAALTEPITAATAGAKQAVSTISKLTGKAFPSLTPSGLFESATKMSTKIPQKERVRLANVALESGIMPTMKGLNKIDDKISKIDNTIADMIDKADLTGKKMPLGKLFKEFKKLKEERLLSTKAKEGVRAINKIRKSMLEANAKIGRGKLTPKEVQTLKKTIYKDLQGAYENIKNSTASIKAQKAVARSAKEFLEELLPEIKGLNKADGDLIKLRSAMEGPVSRIRNHKLMGIGSSIKIGAGAGVGAASGSPEITALLTGLATAQSIFDHPRVKSRLAIILDKLQKKGVEISPDRAIKLMLAEKVIKDTPKEDKENN